MHYSLEPGQPRHIVRVNDDGTDDGTDDPFAVVFDPTAGQTVVDALNATIEAKPRNVTQVVKDCHVSGPVIQIAGHIGSVRA